MRPLKRVIRWFWTTVVSPIWRFMAGIGRIIRRLFALLIWQPFLFFTAPFADVAIDSWHMLGGMGMAVRRMLLWPVWALLLLIYPVSLIYEKIILHLLDWLGILLLRITAIIARSIYSTRACPLDCFRPSTGILPPPFDFSLYGDAWPVGG